MNKRKLLPIKNQISITDRIRCDLIKESQDLKMKDENASLICHSQAECLYDVIETLKIAARMSDALGEMIPIANAESTRAQNKS